MSASDPGVNVSAVNALSAGSATTASEGSAEAMSGRKVNEAVARKLGWKVNRRPYTFKAQDKGERWIIADAVPNYCHSIAAAWELVEFAKPNYSFEIHCWKQSWGEEMKALRDMCIAVFTPRNGTWKQGEPGEADTAPMAICLAFLKLPSAKESGGSASKALPVQHL